MAKTYQSFGMLAAAAFAGVLVAVGMLMLTMLVVVEEPAGAAFPGENGKIAARRKKIGHLGDVPTRATLLRLLSVLSVARQS